jgi:hypothetical protein
MAKTDFVEKNSRFAVIASAGNDVDQVGTGLVKLAKWPTADFKMITH